jgi:hypothetical protein
VQRRKAIPLLIASSLAVSGLLFAAPANAQPTTSHANSDVPAGVTVGDGYVIVNPADAVQSGNQTFYPTGNISDDTLVVIPDAQGHLPGGLTTASLKTAVAQLHAKKQLPVGLDAQIATSSGTAQSAPEVVADAAASPASAAITYYSWAATSAGYSSNYVGGSVWGSDWGAKAGYNFDTAYGYNQQVAGLGKGHYQGYNGSEFGVWTTYYRLGTASDTGASALVPWGEVADNEGFEGWCVVSTACFGDFWD